MTEIYELCTSNFAFIAYCRESAQRKVHERHMWSWAGYFNEKLPFLCTSALDNQSKLIQCRFLLSWILVWNCLLTSRDQKRQFCTRSLGIKCAVRVERTSEESSRRCLVQLIACRRVGTFLRADFSQSTWDKSLYRTCLLVTVLVSALTLL